MAEQRKQASAVAAWPVFANEPSKRWRIGSKEYAFAAAIRNATEVPIYGVIIHYYDDEVGWHGIRRAGLVPPGSEPVIIAGIDEVEDRGQGDGRVDTKRFKVAIDFTDAGGTNWRRDERGQLSMEGQQHRGVQHGPPAAQRGEEDVSR
ncbi:hypothetical protein Misp05_08810 [Micromonospora sp. NBRC 107095]|nr:hypothetical protein Misp05_08810 [Micromonospora sp. NBRC 107095]